MPLRGKKLPKAAPAATLTGLSMTLGSCAVGVEPLEGMGFLTESGSTPTVQRDSRQLSGKA